MKIMGDDSMQEMNLQEKMKKLQKHQAFEAEILANEELIVAVQRVSKTQQPKFLNKCTIMQARQPRDCTDFTAK